MPNLSQSRTFYGLHELMIGQFRGLVFCVCMQCGKFLAAMRESALIEAIDRAHRCDEGAHPRPPSPGPA